LLTVPGIDTVEHEIVEVAHEAGPLSELFDGARVVCNTVGPFAQYGAEVVEACLATHAFLPPTLIYLLLDHPGLSAADLTSLQCLWYGAAPMSADRLEQAVSAIGPVLGQLFGQTEAPMMISTLAPKEHLHADGTLARERFTSAGRPTPLTTVAIMDEAGKTLPPGERGEIVVRGPLVTPGYYKDPAATAEASRHGWHHTGDIGYLDDDNYL
jgi:fatty-acyl-CoA synthase